MNVSITVKYKDIEEQIIVPVGATLMEAISSIQKIYKIQLVLIVVVIVLVLLVIYI